MNVLTWCYKLGRLGNNNHKRFNSDSLHDHKSTIIVSIVLGNLLKMEVLEFELCFYDSCGLHSCPQNILRGNRKLPN